MSHVILVDENDQMIGKEEKLKAHQLGLLHRAFSIFILRKRNKTIETLLQQRNPNKYHSGGLWTNTCCSHPHENEGILQAGQRRLQEELGLSASLHHVGQFHYTATLNNHLIENEIDHVLASAIDPQTIPYNPQEIQACRWENIENLQTHLKNQPELYTPWLKQALGILLMSQWYQELKSTISFLE